MYNGYFLVIFRNTSIPIWLFSYRYSPMVNSFKAYFSSLSFLLGYLYLGPYYSLLIMCQYDELSSIGRRYRRQDEIGTPFCVTVDFDTLKQEDVTVRDRDTMRQERVKIKKLVNYLEEQLS